MPSQPTCIALIESAPEASAAAIESYRARLEAAARALHAPVFRDLRTGAGVNDLPDYAPVNQLDSLRALDFAAGNTLGALSAACEDARGALRWATNPNTLLEAQLGIAMFRQQAAQIADMRVRAPGDALPASCAALAEPPDAAKEGTLCAAMRGEYRWLAQLLPSADDELPAGSGPQWMAPLLHDVDWLLARSANAMPALAGPPRKPPPAKTAPPASPRSSCAGSTASPSPFRWCSMRSRHPRSPTTPSASSISSPCAGCWRPCCRWRRWPRR